MENSFYKIQLKRAVWAAMLKQEKIVEAAACYEKYKAELAELLKSDDQKKQVNAEIALSDNIFYAENEKLAEKFFKDGDYSNALICYKYIFDKYPDNIKNMKNYIKCLEQIEQYDLALIIAQELLKAENTDENNKLISKIYEKNNDFEESTRYYKNYIKLSNKKNYDGADYNTIGCNYFNSYIKKGHNPEDAKQALKYFKKTLSFESDSKVYLKNTIVAAIKTKDYAVEKECWKKFIKCGYLTPDEEFTYCASCMRNGDIEGWKKHYISRFKKTEPTIYPKLKKPEWTGKEDISNSILLVHYEQGYGDNFLMWGYMPRLVKIAKKVIYYIQNNAYDLLKNNDFNVEVHSQKNTDLNKLKYDYHIPSMSVPVALNVTKDNISVIGGYIKADKKLADKYKEKYFNTNKLKIGIAFEGRAANQNRNIPLEQLKMLDNLNNVQFYCLTKDITEEKLKIFKKNKVINIAKNFSTFADTAAAVENTDIIVSSDNCILNLAGAMGKKVIGIFNYHYEFRWYDLSGDDCGWYKSVKPIVNDEYDNWNISIQKAVEEIKKIMN